MKKRKNILVRSKNLERGLKIGIIKFIICWFHKTLQECFPPQLNENKLRLKASEIAFFFGQNIQFLFIGKRTKTISKRDKNALKRAMKRFRVCLICFDVQKYRKSTFWMWRRVLRRNFFGSSLFWEFQQNNQKNCLNKDKSNNQPRAPNDRRCTSNKS